MTTFTWKNDPAEAADQILFALSLSSAPELDEAMLRTLLNRYMRQCREDLLYHGIPQAPYRRRVEEIVRAQFGSNNPAQETRPDEDEIKEEWEQVGGFWKPDLS